MLCFEADLSIESNFWMTFSVITLLYEAYARGGYLVYLSDGDVPFFRVFAHFF